MDKELNKVIIVGTDHHNVLGTVRCFGVNGIKPYGIIVKNDDSPLWVTKSKYWEKTWVIRDDSEIAGVLNENFNQESNKPVIICCSDGAMRYVDMNLNHLRTRFIVPSINDEQGAITRLMNKETQSEFLRKNDINTLDSKIIDLSNDTLPLEMQFPVILKPVLSVEGNKNDITICYTKGEYEKALSDFKHANYERVLLQRYVTKLTEYQLTGSIMKENTSFSVCENIRQWPNRTGSGCYSQLISEGIELAFAEKVMHRLQTIGYRGPIDVEFFRIGNEFYVNEINWRSSGRVYVSLANNVFSTVCYYYDSIGIKFNKKLFNDKQYFAMNEGTDIRNALISKSVPLHRWILDFWNSKCYALWFRKDLKPTLIRYIYFLRKYLIN